VIVRPNVCARLARGDDLSARERFSVDKIEIGLVRGQIGGQGIRTFLRRFAAGRIGHHRLVRLDDRDIRDVVALAEQIAEAFKVFEEHGHVAPIGHAEVVAGRCPFPPAAEGGVVKAVQVEQRGAVQEVAVARVEKHGR